MNAKCRSSFLTVCTLMVVLGWAGVGLALEGDIDGNGLVNTGDLTILLANLNKPADGNLAAGDLPLKDKNGKVVVEKDGVINILDARRLVFLCTVKSPNCNAPPEITSYDGRDVTVTVLDGQRVVTMVTATDPDPSERGRGTFTLEGEDAHLFEITPNGELAFEFTPDFDNPFLKSSAPVDSRGKDAQEDNTYEVTMKVQDPSGQSDTQTITVKVRDNACRIMPLGDSITQDIRGSDFSKDRPVKDHTGYRLPLWNSLVDEGFNVDSINFVGSQNLGDDDRDMNHPDNFDDDNAGFQGARASQIFSLLTEGTWRTTCKSTPTKRTPPFCWTNTTIEGSGTDPDGNSKTWDDHFTDNNILKPETMEYLPRFAPDIILLHIGTNGEDPGVDRVEEVKKILNSINAFDAGITVILAQIINEVPISATTTKFNNRLKTNFVNLDKVVIVDMENKAGLDYTTAVAINPDFADKVHPNTKSGGGYEKMAPVWKEALVKDDLLRNCVNFRPTGVIIN